MPPTPSEASLPLTALHPHHPRRHSPGTILLQGLFAGVGQLLVKHGHFLLGLCQAWGNTGVRERLMEPLHPQQRAGSSPNAPPPNFPPPAAVAGRASSGMARARAGRRLLFARRSAYIWAFTISNWDRSSGCKGNTPRLAVVLPLPLPHSRAAFRPPPPSQGSPSSGPPSASPSRISPSSSCPARPGQTPPGPWTLWGRGQKRVGGRGKPQDGPLPSLHVPEGVLRFSFFLSSLVWNQLRPTPSVASFPPASSFRLAALS